MGEVRGDRSTWSRPGDAKAEALVLMFKYLNLGARCHNRDGIAEEEILQAGQARQLGKARRPNRRAW